MARSRALSLSGQVMALAGVVLVGVAAFGDARHVLDPQHRSGILFFAGLALGVAGVWLRLLGGSRQASGQWQSGGELPYAELATAAPSFTGGIWIGASPHRHTRATSPFARLTFEEQALRITLDFTGRLAKLLFVIYLFGKIFRLNRSYALPYGAIERVAVQRSVQSTAVRIAHHAGAPAFILFWTRDWHAIMREFEQRGVAAEPAVSANRGSR